MSLYKKFDPSIHRGYNGCTCDCHRFPNVHHVMPCCGPGSGFDLDLGSPKEEPIKVEVEVKDFINPNS